MALHNRLDQDLTGAFPTPILRMTLPEAERLNPGMREEILRREAADPGLVRSNVGGWHSREDLLSWKAPAFDPLKALITRGVQRLTEVSVDGSESGQRFELDGDAWANVLRDGGYNKIHNHVGCSWSGVYYVSLGERDPGVPGNGQIEFLDPRLGVDAVGLPGNPFGGTFVVDPEPGLMLVFPGWLYHFVNPFRGRGERITVAFNIRVRARPAG